RQPPESVSVHPRPGGAGAAGVHCVPANRRKRNARLQRPHRRLRKREPGLSGDANQYRARAHEGRGKGLRDGPLREKRNPDNGGDHR
nr:hypothetical protein [Tanacetum cinerariifolium]